MGGTWRHSPLSEVLAQRYSPHNAVSTHGEEERPISPMNVAKKAAQLRRAAQRAALALVAFAATASAQGADRPEWSIARLDEQIPSLQQSLNGRMPILAWDLPDIPQTDAAIRLRENGVLRSGVRTLWSKGIAPVVNLAAVSQGEAFATMDGALALGATLAELNLPVHVFANPPAWMANWSKVPTREGRHYPWDYWAPGPERWFEHSDASGRETWPVFPLASPDEGYIAFKQLLQRLQRGNSGRQLPGVRAVEALWTDFEDLPHPWNGARESQLRGKINGRSVASFYDSRTVRFPGNGRSVREKYGNDVLSSQTSFLQYCLDLRMWLLSESMQKALIDVYGVQSTMGSYGDIYSSPSAPFFDLNGMAYPVTSKLPSELVSMPVAYANNRYLRKYLGRDGQPAANQRNADHVYWHLMLRSFSSSATNAPVTAKSVPWVSQFVREDLSGQFDFEMSVDLYKELLRHLWLRGAQGMYVFNPYRSGLSRSGVYMTADYSIAQLQHATAVLDEMLVHRDFLARGVPMNFDWRPMFDESPVWSGLALDGDAVVRTVSRSGRAAVIDQIVVPGGATFRGLAAPPEGATYLLRKDGTVSRMGVPSPPKLNIAREESVKPLD